MDVVALGKRFEEELNLSDSVDTLGRWMAHYLAELRCRYEAVPEGHEKEESQKNYAEMILRIWEHREKLPKKFRPLGNLEDILLGIQHFCKEPDPWKQPDLSNEWMLFAKNIHGISHSIIRVSALMAVANSRFGRTKRWLDENADALSEEEKQIIQRLDIWLRGGLPWLTREDQVSVAEMEPSERMDATLNELGARLESAQQALVELRASVKSVDGLPSQTGNN